MWIVNTKETSEWKPFYFVFRNRLTNVIRLWRWNIYQEWLKCVDRLSGCKYMEEQSF